MTNILVLQAVSNTFDNSICIYSNTLFAHYNSYDISFKHFDSLNINNNWSKLLFLIEEFKRKYYDYIFVLSNNSYIYDIRQSLTPLLNTRTKDVLMYQNVESNTINTNAFLVHNTTNSLTFFQCFIDYLNNELPLSNSLFFWDTFVINYPNWTDVVQLCPKNLFNIK
jgi:hypothetical protein